MNVVFIPFTKPCSWQGDKAYINLDVRKVKEARKKKCFIVVKLPQGFCRPVDPKALLKYGKKFKEVFLYPDNPMELVGQYFTLFDEETQQRIKEDSSFWYYY
jgi:hypothetical protein